MQTHRQLQKIGYEVVGPIMQMWMLTLEQYWSHLNDADTRFLFCARAGGRIRQLYNIHCGLKSEAWVESEDIMWISRLAACKATFYRNPLAAAAKISKEYSAYSLGELVHGLLRNQPKLLKRIDFTDQALNERGARFIEWLEMKSDNVQVLLDYFIDCEVAFSDYLEILSAGRSRLVLIDTGWQGTTQQMLANSYTQYSWKGLYFGRVLSQPIENAESLDSIIGTLFEANDYDPRRPETAIIHFHHLIETLLESQGPSIEEIPARQFKKIAEKQISGNLKSLRKSSTDAFFSAACDYIGDQRRGGATPSSILKKYQAGLREFERLILFPTKSEALAFATRIRSEDFGKDVSAPIVRHGADFESEGVDERLSRALWKPGQLAIDFDANGALQLQNDFKHAHTIPCVGHSGCASAEIDAHLSRVAIITRTRDRPILLRRAAESVAAQTFKNFIWVVVNDGGDRVEVERILADSAVEPRKILLINVDKSRGMEAASNLGISNSQSNFLTIHDDDDSWSPDFLAETTGYLLSGQGQIYGGVITKVVYVSEEVSGSEVTEHARAPYQDWVRNVEFAEMARENFFPPIAFLFRRSVYEKVGSFNETLSVLGDWFFNLEFLLMADIGVIRTTTAFYHHRDQGFVDTQYSNSVIGKSSKHQEFAAVARNQFFRKHASTNPAATAVLMGYYAKHAGGLPMAASDRSHTAVEWGKADNLDYEKLEMEYDRLWIVDQINRGYLFDLVEDLSGYRSLQINADTNLSDLLATILSRKISIPPPVNFNDAAYLARYADVADACRNGDFVNGYIHYLAYGKNEGRKRFRNS